MIFVNIHQFILKLIIKKYYVFNGGMFDNISLLRILIVDDN
jgi:hypothetical protein